MPIVFLALLIVLGIHEGWKKPFVILLSYGAAVYIVYTVTIIYAAHSWRTFQHLLVGVYTLGVFFYDLKEGYIQNIIIRR